MAREMADGGMGPPHFTRDEFARRQQAACASLAAAGLDALLLFKQESMYWLTGYDTFGFCFFQCLVLRADGRMVLLTRAPDLRQAQLTSVLEDVRVWVDRDGADPAVELRGLLAGAGAGREAAGRGVGDARADGGQRASGSRRRWTGSRGWRMRRCCCRRLRLVKSPAELAVVRRAAELGDAALAAAVEHTRAGADEGVILARMHDAVFEGGGDYPGNPFIIGSGPRAPALPLLFRAAAAGSGRPAHARVRGRLPAVPCLPDAHAAGGRGQRRGIGSCSTRRRRRCWPARPGWCPGPTMGEVFEAHAGVFDRRGLRGAPAQCLRLLAGGGLCAVLDGLADVLRRQPGRDRRRAWCSSCT